MQVFRSERLEINGLRVISIPTECLDVYLDPRDIKDLANPTRRYTMDRFMGCAESGIAGWSIEDKIHVRLDSPYLPEQAKKLAELALDPGGDLYFTIWDSDLLRAASEHEEFNDMSSFVTADPNEKLSHVGIEVVRIHQLSDLALELE